MVVKMNGKTPCSLWWWIIVYTKLVFLIYCTKKFLKILDYFSYSLFSCMRFGNVQNTVGVNHSRCCAIAEILWSCSRLPEISKFLKSEMATLSQLSVWLMGYIPFPHPKGDKNKIAKICWHLLIMYSKTTWPISSKLGSECL